MRSYKVFFVYLLFNWTMIQGQEIKISPKVESLSLDEGEVTLVRLTPGYATAVRMPEEISSVVVGDPAKFKAEHSESEPRLVFLKPVINKPAESNALITMRSGREVSLHLLSSGIVTTIDPRVDFVIEYRSPKSLLVETGGQSFFVSETTPITQPVPEPANATAVKADWIGDVLTEQKALMPPWQGKGLMAAVGELRQQGIETVVGFSILNQSKEVVELLPPQLEIGGGAGGGKQTTAEPIALSEYRMTSRRLRPGERSDGVAVFARPAFKESNEKLELRLAQTDRVERPLLLPVPFIAASRGGSQ